jgi:TetR/AcrR family transcriptional regulator, mexJK operon transcriptional repressor
MRATIVAVAKKVFLREGYQASIDSIIAAAGIARQTLYNHFKDKRSLFQAVIESVSAQTMLPLRTLSLGVDEPLPSALRQFGEAYMRGMLDPDNLATTRLISSAIREFPEVGRFAYETGSKRSIALLADYLKAQRKAGRIRAVSAEAVAESFYGALVGPARFRYLLGVNVVTTPRQQRAYVRQIVQLYVAGLTQGETAT